MRGKPLTGRVRWAIAAGVFVLFMSGVLRPMWSLAVQPRWDGIDFNYPAYAYAADAFRDGRLPLWDPYTGCGQPFISDPAYLWYQPAGVATPFLTKSGIRAYMLLWSFVLVWAGLGAMLLAAVLGAAPLGGLAAAVAFSLGGFFIGHGQHTPYLVTGAWIPWVLAFAYRAVVRSSWRSALATGVALGLSALGGYAGLVIFEVLALPLWLGLAVLASRTSGVPSSAAARRRVGWAAAVLGVSLVLLVLIWSPSLYAFLVEARSFTDRVKPVSDQLALYGNPFPPRALVTLLAPSLSVDRMELFPSDVSMTNAYLGALTLPLVGLWLATEWRRYWWVVAFAAIWLWTSFGADAGLRSLWHHAVPATRYMRHNAMLRVLFLAPLAACLGVALTHHLAGPGRRARLVWGGWLAAVVAAGLALARVLPGDARVARWIGPAVVAAAAAWLLSWYAGAARRTAVGIALVAILAADMTWHLHSNSGTMWSETSGLPLRALERRRPRPSPTGPRDDGPQWRLSKLPLVLRLPVVDGYVALVSADFGRLAQGPFRSVLAAHRYWLSPSARHASPAQAVSALAPLRAADPIPVFVERPEDELRAEPVVPATYGGTRVVSYAPERVELEVSVPPGDGAVLASTERIAPSWRVTVDGSPAPILSVNRFFRGVRVGPGDHRVVFEYRPTTFIWLYALSWAVIAGAIAACVVRRPRRSAVRPEEAAAPPALAAPDGRADRA